MKSRQDIIQAILEIELEMFLKVKGVTPAACQQNSEAFREIRKSIYENWSEELLQSYLEDLTQAKQEGRNLVTEKYARMDGLLPPLPTNPKIDEIVEIETQWQKEIKRRYPALYNFTCRKTDPTGDGSNLKAEEPLHVVFAEPNDDLLIIFMCYRPSPLLWKDPNTRATRGEIGMNYTPGNCFFVARK